MPAMAAASASSRRSRMPKFPTRTSSQAHRAQQQQAADDERGRDEEEDDEDHGEVETSPQISDSISDITDVFATNCGGGGSVSNGNGHTPSGTKKRGGGGGGGLKKFLPTSATSKDNDNNRGGGALNVSSHAVAGSSKKFLPSLSSSASRDGGGGSSTVTTSNGDKKKRWTGPKTSAMTRALEKARSMGSSGGNNDDNGGTLAISRHNNSVRSHASASVDSSRASSVGSNSRVRKLVRKFSHKKRRPSDASVSSSRNTGRGCRTSSSMDEMEYSSLGASPSMGRNRESVEEAAARLSCASEDSITMRASQRNSRDAVGAAAMAIEYGVGEDHFIGMVDGAVGSRGRDGDRDGDNNVVVDASDEEDVHGDARISDKDDDFRKGPGREGGCRRTTVETINTTLASSTDRINNIPVDEVLSLEVQNSSRDSRGCISEDCIPDNNVRHTASAIGNAARSSTYGKVEDARMPNAPEEEDGRDDRGLSDGMIGTESPDGNKANYDGGGGTTTTVASKQRSSPARPRMKKMSSWKKDDGYDTVDSIDHDDCDGMEEEVRAKAATSYRPKSNSSSSQGQQQRHKLQTKSCNDLSSLDILGRTVAAVTAALRSGCVPTSGEEGLGLYDNPFRLSGVRFHPNGCVWDATLMVLAGKKNSFSSSEDDVMKDCGVREGFDFPIRATCCAQDGVVSTGPVYTVELALEQTGQIECLWSMHSNDITAALEWVWRKVRRGIKRGLGKGIPTEALPRVSIRLPDMDRRGGTKPKDAIVMEKNERDEVKSLTAPPALVDPVDASAPASPPATKMARVPEKKSSLPSAAPVMTEPGSDANTKEEGQAKPKIEHEMPRAVDVHRATPGHHLPGGDSDDEIGVPQSPQEPQGLPDLVIGRPSPRSLKRRQEQTNESIMSLNEGPSFLPDSIPHRGKPSMRSSTSPRTLKLMQPPSQDISPAASPTAKSKESAFGMSAQTVHTVSTFNVMTESDSSSSTNGREGKGGEGKPKTEGLVKNDSHSRHGSMTERDVRMAAMGLMSQKSIRRLSQPRDEDTETDPSRDDDITKRMSCDEEDHLSSGERRHNAEGLQRLHEMGLMSRGSLERRTAAMSARQRRELKMMDQQQSEKECLIDRDSDGAEAEMGPALVNADDYCNTDKPSAASSPESTTGLVPSQVIQTMKRGSFSDGEIRMAKRGLLSQRSILRLSITEAEPTPAEMEVITDSMGENVDESQMIEDADDGVVPYSKVIHNMKRQNSYSAGEIRMATRGCMSRRSVMKLSSAESMQLEEVVQDFKNEKEASEGQGVKKNVRTVSGVMREEGRIDGEIRLARRGLVSHNTMRRCEEMINRASSLSDSDGSMDFGEVVIPATSFSEKDIHQAKMGLLSGQSMAEMGINAGNLFSGDKVDGEELRQLHHGSALTNDIQPSMYYEEVGSPATFSQKLLEQADKGLINDDSLERQGIDRAELYKAVQQQRRQQQGMPRSISGVMAHQNRPEGEIRMAKRGILSKKSEANFRRIAEDGNGESSRGGRRGLKKSLSVTFSDNNLRSLEQKEAETKEAISSKMIDDSAARSQPKPVAIKAAKNTEEDNDVDRLVFSNNELKEQSQDVLTEGQYYLGISMLVYMYSHLRETCRMGHTRVGMADIDVHSLQSQYKGGATRRYLEMTKTAGSIIRVVIDELDGQEDDDQDHDIIGDENKEYEKSITAQFRSWIEDSRVNQLDEETENMIAEMKRKVARHRWRRAISAVRLSYRLSGGKRPKWENPVTAPGCENQNRFVDMNAMVSEAMRTQPKYFREGSVMHNLIESGIELVWFSDMSQNDVVYGICVQRQEKKVTVVFRGTVNAHNWKMNLKFDTNEYHNPVKQHYPGREDELSLHSGFALYLLRKRKDTGISKLQEIFDKIDEIGREMAPDGNYKLSITGHSLGGALATLCGFYVAARSRFAHLPTIYIWTFAAPRVGTKAFIHAWQHLERTGRIRHARFSITQDLVPLVPFCNFEMDDLQFYKHVGMRVQLHSVGRIGKWRLRRNLDVTYPLRHDWSSEIRRVFMNNIFANLTTPSGLKNNHKLTEYQKRLHFAMSYRKALGSGVFFSDMRRNRIKTLDEYYHIRAQITSESIAEEILHQDKPRVAQQDPSRSLTTLSAVILLLLTWMFLILSISTDIFERHPLTIESILAPFALVASSICHVIHLPVAIPVAIYGAISLQAEKVKNTFFMPANDVTMTAFIGRRDNSAVNSLINELAVGRVNHYMKTQHRNVLHGAQYAMITEGSMKLKIFDSTAKGLFDLAALVDGGSTPQLTIAASSDAGQSSMMKSSAISQGHDATENETDVRDQIQQRVTELQAAESRLKPLQEYATGVTFDPKLDNLYLVGAGVRKKSIIKLYAVAMYSSATVINTASPTTLQNVARSFDQYTPTTTFVLEMVYSIGAEKIAGAIAESVKPRYGGSPLDINTLEALIVEGINKIGGQAVKGTIFRFDCTKEGVGVSVDGTEQGVASFDGLGSAFVDVFLDDNAVSPTLVDSCVETWSSQESKALSSSFVQLAKLLLAEHSTRDEQESTESTEKVDNTDTVAKKAIESQMRPLQDYTTRVSFDPKLDEELYLVGVGVRKKSILSVYAVSMYSSIDVIEKLSHLQSGKHHRQDASRSLGMAARTFGPSASMTTFVLEMVYSVGAEKIAGAIADGVKPRYIGAPSDVNALESLIIDGVNRKGGTASKGTVFRFDCSESGVSVTVDGTLQGMANFEGIGSAFVDVFMDNNAVSTSLVESCLNTWVGVSLGLY